MPKPEKNLSTETNTDADSLEAADETNMTPLQKLKARQAAQASNRAAKEKRPDPSADKSQGGSGTQATPKQMRSSASKIGS